MLLFLSSAVTPLKSQHSLTSDSAVYRFKTTPNSVLLATDIAARGLDIPAVDHVIHYQIPRSTDVYVHRNGRTARAMRAGFSMLMCAPDERRVVRALLTNLGRRKSKHLFTIYALVADEI